MDLGLSSRVYLVTGGSRGLGRATAEALVADGARVVVSSRSEQSVEAAVGELGGSAVAVGVPADLADEQTPRRLIEAAQSAFGRLDGALISVGGPPGGQAMSMTDEQWRAAFDSVFLGAVRCARSVADALADGGAITMVLSTSVKSPIPGLAISNGLRPGLAMVAKSLADELGPRGIRVNGLMPGQIATDRMKELTDGASPEDLERARLGIPLRRQGDPVEFGRVAAFTLSPAASYLSGAMIPVDGGALRTI